MRQTNKLLPTLIGLLGLALLAITPALAQQPPTQPPPNQPAPDVEISDDEMENAASAYIEVMDIQQRYGPQVQAATDQQEAQELQMQANAEMEKVIDDHDLTVEKYNQVIAVAQADEEKRQEFLQIVQRLEDEDEDDGSGR